MGQVGYVQAGVDAAKGQLEDDDPIIRIHAAIALLKMDDELGASEIEAALASGDPELAQTALQGLEESGYFGVPLLVDLSGRDWSSPSRAALGNSQGQRPAHLPARGRRASPPPARCASPRLHRRREHGVRPS